MHPSPQSQVFVLPHDDGYLVYAPLAGRVVFVNAACAEQLREYLLTGDPAAVSADVRASLGGLEWLSAVPVPVPLPVDRLFHPRSVTLFLTNRCNLRCAYCYAEAGDHVPHDMPSDVFRAAIDLVCRNAARAGHAPLIGFHGGGEPTLAWDALQEAVTYARQRAGAGPTSPPDGPVRFGITTNGVMPPEHAEWVAAHFPVVTLSFDGPADIHDRHRPGADGRGTFDRVMAFAEVLRRRETPFVVRATITRHSVRRMVEMVEFFVTQAGCRRLHFEPAFASGRCCGVPPLAPAPEDFAAGFVPALDTARRLNAHLRFSAARLNGTFLSFCGCSQDAFNVTHEGDVTACYEVCERSQPLACRYFFGRFDAATGSFRIDPERLAALRSLTVFGNPLCEGCFAKWNCAGDCPVKRPFGQPGGADGAARCEMIRSITKELLVRGLSGESR